MFARMTHGIPEYNALTDKHCAQHNFLDLAPLKQLKKAGLVKKVRGRKGSGAYEVVRQPSKYLFFGSQPDGPESTRPATGKRSERVRRFKKSREPSLAQVDAERKAAIQRCKLEPLDTTHGVNSALRVVLSSPDLRSKRQAALAKQRHQHTAPGYSPVRRGSPSSERPKTVPGRARRRKDGSPLAPPRRSVGAQRSFETIGAGTGSYDGVTISSWDGDDRSASGERRARVDKEGNPLPSPVHIPGPERLHSTNVEYTADHRVPAEDLNAFIEERRRREEAEAAEAAELNRRGAIASGYYARRHNESRGGSRAATSPLPPSPVPLAASNARSASPSGGDATSTSQQRQAAAAQLMESLQSTEVSDAVAAARNDVEHGWHAMQESAEEADAQIQRHFARLRAVLDEREKELRNNLRTWVGERKQAHDACATILSTAATGLATALRKCHDTLERRSAKDAPTFVQDATAAVTGVRTARNRAKSALDPSINPKPNLALLRLQFTGPAGGATGTGAEGSAPTAGGDSMAATLAQHGSIVIVPAGAAPVDASVAAS